MRSAPPPPARLPKPPPPPPRLPIPDPPARLLARLPPCRPTCCRALACRLESESPRAVPPNLFAVPRSPYGAPPRCCGLCFQPESPRPPPPRPGCCDGRFPPPMLLRLPLPIFELRLELLLLLMLMLLLPPQPQPQPQPPLQNAPIIMPTPKEIASPPA